MSLKSLILAAALAGIPTGLAIAAPVDAPADQAAPACRAPDKPLTEQQRKFHPGHYVTIGRDVLSNGLADVLVKGVTGVQIRYRWADLEPLEGQYQFAAVTHDLAVAKRANTQLVVLIEDKSFTDDVPVPGYLQAKYTIRNSFDGYTAMRWDPYVNDRLKLLVARLGALLDCDANFEGIAFQESSLSIEEGDLRPFGYTAEKYRDSLIGLLRSASASVPRSRVFWYMNFLPGNQRYIGEVAGAVIGTGVVMGGPDILPGNRGLERRTYPYYDEFRGRLKLFNSMQHNSYRHPLGNDSAGGVGGGRSGYWSMEDLFQFALTRLHVDYLFWDYHLQRRPPDSHDWGDALEVIARHPTFSP